MTGIKNRGKLDTDRYSQKEGDVKTQGEDSIGIYKL